MVPPLKDRLGPQEVEMLAGRLADVCTEFSPEAYVVEMTRVHLRRWVNDPDKSVRRLASEGARPLLPWAPRARCLTDDPTIGFEVLEA